jgi:hypothetical protein
MLPAAMRMCDHCACVASCYLFNKAAIGHSYSRPGHGVSCQTTNYTQTRSRHTRTNGDHRQPQISTGAVLSRNLLPLNAPGQFLLPPATVTASVGDDGTITLQASATAVFVWLSTTAQGRFAQNGMALRPGATTIEFVPPP